MTSEEIIRMAREADKYADKYAPSFSRKPDEWRAARDEHFSALVAAAEREACADILDRNADRCDPCSIAFDVLDSNAKAIRARSNK